MQLLGSDVLFSRDGVLLTDEGGAPCCCGEDRVAHLVCECCDGDPCLWQILPPGCFIGRTIRMPDLRDESGNLLCFRVTDTVRPVSELISAGIPFRQPTGVVCLGEGDCRVFQGTECRVCRRECCICATLPDCQPDGFQRRCLLGSKYRLEVTYNERILTTTRHSGQTSTQSPECPCAVTPDLFDLRTERNEWRASTVHARGLGCWEDPDTYERRVTVFRNGLECATGEAAMPWAVNEDCTLRGCNGGESPTVQVLENSDTGLETGLGALDLAYEGEAFATQHNRPPDSEGYISPCAFDVTATVCERVGSELDPCPGPTNPIVRVVRERYQADQPSCLAGHKVYELWDTWYVCGQSGSRLGVTTHTRREWAWNISIQSRNGCEAEGCDDPPAPLAIIPSPRPALIVPPAVRLSGCGGCRGEYGI